MKAKYKKGDQVIFNNYYKDYPDYHKDTLQVTELFYDINPKYYRDDDFHLYEVFNQNKNKLISWIYEYQLNSITEQRNNKLNHLLNT